METKGTIQAISNKDGKYGMRLNDEWYNAFGDAPAKKGDQVTVEYEVNGNYKNIKKVSISQAAPNKLDKFEEAGKSKIACVIISYAKDLATSDKIKVDEIEKYAKSFMNLYDELCNPKTEVKEKESKESKEEIEVVKM